MVCQCILTLDNCKCLGFHVKNWRLVWVRRKELLATNKTTPAHSPLSAHIMTLWKQKNEKSSHTISPRGHVLSFSKKILVSVVIVMSLFRCFLYFVFLVGILMLPKITNFDLPKNEGFYSCGPCQKLKYNK